MEFLLQPLYHGESRTARTPYQYIERYDRSSWKSYLCHKGRPELELTKANKFDPSKIIRSLKVKLIPVKEQQAFLQTWLYFSPIAEFLGANSEDSADSSLVEGQAETLKFIYDTILVQECGSTFVVLKKDLLQTLWVRTKSAIPQDVEPRKAWYHSLGSFLVHTSAIMNTLPKDFCYVIRFSISALAEMFTQIVVSSLHGLEFPDNDAIAPPRLWSSGYFDDDIKKCMIANGWCLSDITRFEVNFRSLQSLSIVRTMDWSLPRRNHENCTNVVYDTNQINKVKYIVSYHDENCQCGQELSVDNERITKILLQGDQFPLLHMVGES